MFYVKDERVPQLTECEINNEQGRIWYWISICFETVL